MSRHLKSFRTRIIIAGMLVVGCGLAAAASVDSRPVRERAKAWTETHRHALPTTLEELAAYPVEYQQEIVRVMPVVAKSALWRTKLHSIANSGTLTAAQRDFVIRTIELVTPEAFASATPPELCAEIARLFPDKVQRGMFRALGYGVSPTFAWRPAVITLAERVQAKLVTQALAPDCNCRGGGWCECGSSESCENITCNSTEDCGCIFSGTCDKVCQFVVSSPIRGR